MNQSSYLTREVDVAAFYISGQSSRRKTRIGFCLYSIVQVTMHAQPWRYSRGQIFCIKWSEPYPLGDNFTLLTVHYRCNFLPFQLYIGGPLNHKNEKIYTTFNFVVSSNKPGTWSLYWDNLSSFTKYPKYTQDNLHPTHNTAPENHGAHNKDGRFPVLHVSQIFASLSPVKRPLPLVIL